VVAALRRGKVRALTVGLAALMLALMAWRLSGIVGPFRWVTAVAWLQRPDSLLAGVVTALISAQLPAELPRRVRRLLPVAAVVATAVLVVTILISTGFTERHLPGLYVEAFPPDIQSDTVVRGYWMNWGFALGALSSSVLAFCAFRLADWRGWGWLEWRPLSWTGAKLSYSLYLLHVPVLIVLFELFSPDGAAPLYELPRWAFVALALVLPFGLAYPCYRLVETRALRLRSRFGFSEDAASNATRVPAHVFTATLPSNRRVTHPAAVVASRVAPRSNVGAFLLTTYSLTVVAVLGRMAGLSETRAALVAALGIAAGLVVALGWRGSDSDRRVFRHGWSMARLSPVAFAFMAVPVLCHFVALDVIGAMSNSASLGLTVASTPVAIVTFLVAQLVFSVVEEAGWRGFLLPRLSIGRSPLRATALVAAAWLAWFAPAFAGGAVDAVEVGFFAVTIFAMSVVQTAMWHRTRGSILAAVGLHLMWSLTNLIGGGGVEVFTAIAAWAVAIAVIAWTRGRLWAPDSAESVVDVRFAGVRHGLTGSGDNESREGARHG
jgi:membrane protease YdiL (CAAX protease family)